MGVELRKTKSKGTTIATHTGQNLFAGDSCAASTIYLKAKAHEAAATPSALYHKAEAFQAQLSKPGVLTTLRLLFAFVGVKTCFYVSPNTRFDCRCTVANK
jgi:hypothetical protein